MGRPSRPRRPPRATLPRATRVRSPAPSSAARASAAPAGARAGRRRRLRAGRHARRGPARPARRNRTRCRCRYRFRYRYHFRCRCRCRRPRCRRLIACCLLPVACCLLPPACCLLLSNPRQRLRRRRVLRHRHAIQRRHRRARLRRHADLRLRDHVLLARRARHRQPLGQARTHRRQRLAGVRLDEGVHRRKPVLRRLCHRLLDRVPDLPGNCGATSFREVGFSYTTLNTTSGDRRAPERGPPRQHLVQDHAEREDVGALVDVGVIPGRLLRRHVLRRAEQRAVLGLDRQRAGDLRDAEVEQLGDLDHAAVDLGRDQEDVSRLEIAMDHAGAVRGGQPRADLAHDRQHLLDRQRAARQPVGERLTLQEVEHQVRRAVGELVEVDDLDDVGVTDARRGLGLVAEPRERLLVALIRVQRLDRDLLAGQPVVPRDEHGAHAAAPDQRLDRVRADDRPDVDRRTR